MRHDPSAIMLFAAGFGTRMGALTADLPKPLIKVAGRPLIDHALSLASDIPTRVVNAHYNFEKIQYHLAGTSVCVVVETPEILETGGGLRAALPQLGSGPVFTLNTDSVWTGPNPLTTLRDAWDPDQMDALLLLVPTARALGHEGPGDFALGPDRRIVRGPGHVYSGAQILKTGELSQIEQSAFSLNVLWDQMARAGRLFAAVHRGGWCDVGRPEGIATAEAMLASPPDLLS